MLYEMLTGKVPFEADTPVSVALKQIQSKAVLPREVNPSIPEGLQEITMHAMEKDAGKRYQSAAQMLRDIDEFKRDPPSPSSTSTSARPSRTTTANIPTPSRTPAAARRRKRKRTKPRRAPVIPVLAGVTAAFVIVSAAFIGWMIYLNNPFASVEDKKVPNLVGEKYDVVRVSPKYEEFEIVPEDDPVYNTDYDQGRHLRAEPKEGTTVKVGSEIRVKISKGKQMVTLPTFRARTTSRSSPS